MYALRDVDAGERPLEELRREIVTGAAEAAAHQAGWLACVAEFDEREGWWEDGVRSMAHWLSWRCSLSPRTAREHVRVAKALASLGRLRAVFAEGRLSYSKVRAICRVATPANESLLVDLALELTASQLERVVAGYEQAGAPPLTQEDEAARRAKCGVTTWTDRDGLHHTEIVSPPEDGKVIDLAIEEGREAVWASTRTAAKGPMGRLDSLVVVLRRGLANLERGGADASRHLIVTHVRDGRALVSDDGRVDLGNGAVVHPRVLQRLGCDALFQGMLEGLDGRPLDLGRRVRSATEKQKLAVMAMYPTCEGPGCTVKAKHCEFHHLEFWNAGGLTDLANLRPLCRHHHRLVHEGGWRLVLDVAGRVVMLPPGGGEPVVPAPPLTVVPVPAGAARAANRARGVVVADDRATVEGFGGRAGGERLTSFGMVMIVDALVAAGPPAGAPAWAGGAPPG